MSRPAALRRMRLTAQQQAIVDHNEGPALVYAVAGAGKTTAMVHRIGRLVAAGIFPAGQILATSFNRDANREIAAELVNWPGCAAVRVKTLHAFGYGLIRLAAARGYRPAYLLASGAESERQILTAAVATARRRRVPYAAALERLDGEDFLNYVRANKAALAYPDLAAAALPRRGRAVARRAHAPAETRWYLDLYRLFEHERQERHLLTFDDMPLIGWEVLVRHPDLLAEVQARGRCVLVDEYQDINRAQAELLDLITAPQRNYMAIGDDDQAIYSWRGADPGLLLGFGRRYRAAVYYMTENFRGRAVHLALANSVIVHNRHRQPKILGLTRGFGGTAALHLHATSDEMAQTIARLLQAALEGGLQPPDAAILVRVHAQAPLLVEALRAARIPFVLDVDEREGERAAGSGVTLTTIHKAKGREWAWVCVPGCNAGVLPQERGADDEEERRLFYVALTRAREELHLSALAGEPLSPFLSEVKPSVLLDAVQAVEGALAAHPQEWRAADYLAVGVNAKRLYLADYFSTAWWDVSPAQRRQVAGAVLDFYAALRQRHLFRGLGLTGEDERRWRALADGRHRPVPLVRPDLEPLFVELRARRG